MGKPREMTYDAVLGALKVGIGDEFAHGVQDLLELLGGEQCGEGASQGWRINISALSLTI